MTATLPGTTATTAPDVPGTGGLATARERLAPVLALVAERARERETERSLPHEEVRLLAEAGFGAARLPVEDGGWGLTLAELTELLVDLGHADSNQPQLWRNHLAFVEDRLWHRHDARSAAWLRRVAAGEVVGGAWSERPGKPGVWNATRLDDATEPATLTGTKFYSTGSIYADWVTVTAKASDESDVLVVVDARADGVTLVDDWDGIGQRLTGSGTTVLDQVVVDADARFGHADRSPHQEILYQLVLLAALAGVALAARDDVVAAVRARVRNYPMGLAAEPKDDAILQEVVGTVAAHAAAARAVLLDAARTLDAGLAELAGRRDAGEDVAVPAVGWDSPEGDGPQTPLPLRAASVATWEAQLVVAQAALEASTELYDALGSSAVERRSLLDRHWRNARTLVSHNPRRYKARLLGDWYLNGTDPYPWARRHEAP